MKTQKIFGLITILVMLVAAMPATSAGAAGAVSVDKGDVALSGGFQAGSFPETWDLTSGDLTLSFTYDGNGLVDDAGAHAWAELGIRDSSTNSNFNPNNKGVWFSADYDWTTNTFDPDINPNLDLDDKLLLQKVSGIGEAGYDQPSAPPVPGNNHRFWWDRDGVDPWQSAETANTAGLYNIVMTLHATSATTGTAFMTINGLDQGFETDGNWSTLELTPAGMTFTGDMTRMQVFYGIYGYGAVHHAAFKDIVATGFPADLAAPITTNVVASPNPAAIGGSVTVTANVDDSTTGGWNIASAAYSLDGGTSWLPMTASDGMFDEVGEEVTVSFNASLTAGIYTLCVRGTDVPGNAGTPECTMFVVYDPTGGFVTGGGWIDSPAGQTVAGFNTIPDPLAGNYPSQPYQAQQTAEFGDHIQFSGTARDLSSVTVTMSSWAKHSDYPGMPAEGFTHPLTLNLYNVDRSGTTPAPGTLIKSVTQNFVMQWRPEPDSTCPGGTAWRAGDGTCYNGFAFNIVFDLRSEGITLPDEIIYGIASNTQTWGYAPIGAPGPYNSLNFALNNISGPSTGIDVEPDAVFWNTKTAAWYSDDGAGGTGTFRRDTGWTGYVPAVRFFVTTPGAYVADPTLGGKATFGFVSKYKKGATVPDGNTEFQFKAGGLNFSSTSYQWLVVNQAGTNAQFKGVGTINGSGDYGFMLWATDGSPDKFRIKIWDAATEVVVYDNGTEQAIGGGSIVVHKK